MLFFSLTVVIMRFCLAIHKLNYVYILTFFTILEIALLSIFHSTPYDFVKVLLIINFILFLVSYIYIKNNHKFLFFRGVINKNEK